MPNTYNELTLDDKRIVGYHSLKALEDAGLCTLSALPYAVRILLESLLRNQGHPAYNEEHIKTLAAWTPDAAGRDELPFLPARVLLQDFTGVPCVADLAALRDAVRGAGQDPSVIEPRIPVDLIIDHSVQLDAVASPDALDINLTKEFERNNERYRFLRWGQQAFRALRVIPPGIGICHQVNLEYLGRCVVLGKDAMGRPLAYPDTLVGTDSHTTMINGLGILGWGVGGIEAEAAMLGQPIPLLTPRVVGVRLSGALPPGATATDLTLLITQRLREVGVVGAFVEYFGPGLDGLTAANRAMVANMAPEYGATTGLFPIDGETLAFLRATGREEDHVRLVEAYARAQGLFRTPDAPEPTYSEVVEIDLASVEPCVAGPRRPHDRVTLGELKPRLEAALKTPVAEKGFGVADPETEVTVDDRRALRHGDVVLASITSCTNTSDPSVLVTAGLVAQRAIERGLRIRPTVRTSFAPGSRAVTRYLDETGLLRALEELGFNVAAYGCATCIGNSGPLDPAIERAIEENRLTVAGVLSGNRNFEGRIHPAIKANYLASPPLVIAYALAGTMRIDLNSEPLGTDTDGRPVYLRELWPDAESVRALMARCANPAWYRELYADPDAAHPAWTALPTAEGRTFAWEPDSTYIRQPSFAADIPATPEPVTDIVRARALGFFGDFITTDHISPAGSIKPDSPAGRYLIEHGVRPEQFNSYGSRRGNHEVMVRGTFANVRLRNRLVDREGGYTLHLPDGEPLAIHDAAMRYAAEGVPLVVLAGKMYGAGSSRDWAAKGTRMLGVRAVIAESFERIHRSNLVEMGVLPLEFVDGQTADILGLTGRERFSIAGIAEGPAPGARLTVTAEPDDGPPIAFEARCRIDTPIEQAYYRQGGILPYVARERMRGDA